ncbi:hypothetical protein [uncultured Desulfovibrio sp.]|uniref:hypothetical protein n=1 Tax=uncultured Desulfovibrio sp. TaxID=167968 RepID=UPI0003A102E8|nr:hypothetical protein [uncultured Desulfovibrio sp.]
MRIYIFFGVIIANNMLYNAANMVQTMRWLNSPLDHNGCVLILEQTGANSPLLVTMEFLIDFSKLEDERVEQDSPFFSEEHWKNTLDSIVTRLKPMKRYIRSV